MRFIKVVCFSLNVQIIVYNKKLVFTINIVLQLQVEFTYQSII